MGIALTEIADSYAGFLPALEVLCNERALVYSCQSILEELGKETDGRSGFSRSCEELPKKEVREVPRK